MEIELGGIPFEVAPVLRRGKPILDMPSIHTSSRASQPGDGRLTFAEWRVDGHDFNGFEQIPAGASSGFLGRSYGANTDGRDLGLDHLGPAIQVMALNTFDGVLGDGSLGPAGNGGLNGSFGLGPPEQVGDNTGSSNGADVISKNGVPYQYIIRGSRPAKVDLRTMTPVKAGLVLQAPATDIIATVPTSAAVGQEISIAMGPGRAYQTLQRNNVGTSPTIDTWAANSAGQDADVFGAPPDRTILMSGSALKSNFQTGSVTMAAPNWQATATLPLGDSGTGFALDGSLWVIGTDDGPMVVDSDSGDPFPLIDELSQDPANCRKMITWFALGVIIPLLRSLRWLKSGGGKSFGPETFLGNTTPVSGGPEATSASERELFTTEYNPITGDTYLIAWSERRPGDQHANPVSPYVLAKFTGLRSRWLRWLGTVNGIRTNDTLDGGYGPNAFYVTCGRTQRWIDDPNYQMALSGTTYGTETRRDLDTLKDIEFVEFEAAGTLDASKTITPTLVLDGVANAMTAVVTAGVARLYAAAAGVPTAAFQGIHRIAPQWALVSNSAFFGPMLRGPFRVYYRLRPTTVRQWTVSVLLKDDGRDTPAGYEASLRAMINAGSQLFEDLDRNSSVYVKVLSVSDGAEFMTEGSEDDGDGLQRYVSVALEEWTAGVAA